MGFKYRGNTYAEDAWDLYYYERNLQGDIIAVYNVSGTKLISYVYTAYGTVTVTHSNSGASTTAINNPLKYRGYYYDSDLGLYYLQNRYYDTNTCRFINADDSSLITATPTALTDKNLFAYCDNNPVMRTDSSGEFWNIIIGAAVGALIGGVSSIIAQAVNDQEINWAEVGVSAASGALTGAITSACPGMGAVATGVIQGTIAAATHVATEMVNGNTPTVSGTLAAGVTAGVLAGGTKAIGNLINNGFKIQKIGKLEASNHPGDAQFGIKYQINKSNGKTTIRSMEFHYNHSHKGYQPHWQQNSWNTWNDSVSSMKHWTWWGKRI